MPKKNSIVLDLQKMAGNSGTKVSDLLRQALILSTKLNLVDFKAWVEAELRGYTGESKATPDYRVVRALVKSLNPYRGYVPVRFDDAATEDMYSRTVINNSLPDLEYLASSNEDGLIMQKLAPEHSAVAEFGMGVRFDTYRMVSHNQVSNIIESVRTTILEWALRLEAEGILGDGMTFSDSDEKRAAEKPSIHIGTFHGILGDVSAHNVQVGSYSAIHEQLKAAGIPQDERNQLENILEELKKDDKPEDRKTIVQRGMGWLGRNGKNLGGLASVIHSWIE